MLCTNTVLYKKVHTNRRIVTTYDTPATAGKQAIAGMVATARIPALSKGHQQEEAKTQQ